MKMTRRGLFGLIGGAVAAAGAGKAVGGPAAPIVPTDKLIELSPLSSDIKNDVARKINKFVGVEPVAWRQEYWLEYVRESGFKPYMGLRNEDAA
jgi:hypothetical protein